MRGPHVRPGMAPGPPLIALEGDAAAPGAVDATVERLTAAGCRVVRPPLERVIGRPPGASRALLLTVSTASDAEVAVRAALRGFGLVVVGRASREVLDRLYDDLRRFGRLDVRVARSADPESAFDGDERALLAHLSEGLTLGEAAAAVHVSRRTADRRLASVRRKLGVATTIEALARLRGAR